MPYTCFVMKKKNSILIYALLLILVLILQQACTYNHLPESNKTIILNWYPAPANQTIEEFTTGMAWLFSYLGAKLPSNQFEEGVKFIASNKIEINLDELGFADFAVNHLETLISQIKQTEEYKVTGGIDAGRFFALCFNSTNQYYKITGAAKTYDEFRSKYASFMYKTFVCDTSSISSSSRIINYAINDLNIQKSFFISEEGNGKYSAGTFVRNGFIEAFDYMENGQPRFVIYNQKKELYVPSNSFLHPAGKPAKCMWCHESGMQPLFTNTIDIAGFISTTEFLADVQNFTISLNAFHNQRSAKLNFKDKKAHTQGEYVYLCFYEPNANRLAGEWSFTVEKVNNLLAGIAKHNNPEFPFLKDVYYRNQIEKFAPYYSIQVSNEMREASTFEPNYLK